MAHGDYTGQQKQALAHQYAEQQALAAQSKTLVTQVVTEGQDEVIDLRTDQDRWFADHAVAHSGDDGGEVEVVDVKDPIWQPMRFRASEDLDNITIGKDHEFSLKGGRTYILPKWKVQHLDEKGLVYH